jgi:molybdopterin molybdotransferase
MTAPLAAAEAARRILEDVRRQPALRMPLDDALDAVLAEDIVSPLDIPAWTNSAMDGYATRGDDVRGATQERPVRLTVVEHLPAGRFPTRPIAPGECARIFTGAPLPEGADTVVRQEDTDQGADVVTIYKDRDVGVNIRRAGEDIRKGRTVLQAGTELGPAQLGVLASLAVASPLVYRQPRVAILGSGDEIVDVDQPEEILSGRKTASSNTHTLLAMVRRAGGEPVNLGIARDTPESLRERLTRALDADLLVTTAGISVGEHDYLRAVLDELGAEQRFWKLRMRQGAPVGFGLLQDIPWIGLPGNPVSTMVTFELFVRPAIRKMAGHPLPFRRTVPVRVAEPIHLKPRLQHFLRAVVADGPDIREARLTGPQGSGILTSMILANALLIVPEGQFETPVGATLRALLLDDPVHAADAGF